MEIKKIVLANMKGFAISAIIYAIAVFLIAIVLCFTPAPESQVKYYMLGALAVACGFIGVYMGGNYRSRGLIVGMIYGFLLLLMIMVARAFLFPGEELSVAISRLITAAAAGGAGGLVGISISSE